MSFIPSSVFEFFFAPFSLMAATFILSSENLTDVLSFYESRIPIKGMLRVPRPVSILFWRKSTSTKKCLIEAWLLKNQLPNWVIRTEVNFWIDLFVAQIEIGLHNRSKKCTDLKFYHKKSKCFHFCILPNDKKKRNKIKIFPCILTKL